MGSKKPHGTGQIIIGISLAVLTILILLLYLLCLTGSSYSDSHIPPIFLAQIQQSNTSIFVGFYGLCTSPSTSSSSPSRTCTPTIYRSTNSLTTTLLLSPNNTTQSNLTNNTTTTTTTTTTSNTGTDQIPPLFLLTTALALQRKILISPLPLATLFHLLPICLQPVSLLLTRTSSSSRHLSRGRRRQRVRKILRTASLILYYLSASLAVTSALLALESVNAFVYGVQMLQDASGDGSGTGTGSVSVTPGGLLIVLLWVVAGLQVVFVGLVAWAWRSGVRKGEGGGGGGGGSAKRADFGVSWWRGEEGSGMGGGREGAGRVFVF